MSERPALQVAVVMHRQRLGSPWQPWRWTPVEVTLDQGTFGHAPRLLRTSDAGDHWLHPGLQVELYTDDVEGYWLNLTTDAPSWFVMWRADESDAGAIAQPMAVSLSYHDAGRWLDAQERVDRIPAPADVVEWLRAFVAMHPPEEPRKRQRPVSFVSPSERFERHG